MSRINRRTLFVAAAALPALALPKGSSAAPTSELSRAWAAYWRSQDGMWRGCEHQFEAISQRAMAKGYHPNEVVSTVRFGRGAFGGTLAVYFGDPWGGDYVSFTADSGVKFTRWA